MRRCILSANEAETVQGAPVQVGFAKGQVRINEAALLDADIAASNGTLHVIDTVLLPPAPKTKTVLDVARQAGSFKTLLAAVDAAGLNSAVSSEGPFTVFAPTDDAFAVDKT